MVLLFPSIAQGGGLTMDDLYKRNGLYFKKLTNVPFSGKVTGKRQGSFAWQQCPYSPSNPCFQ